jgi:hypothetical protein
LARILSGRAFNEMNQANWPKLKTLLETDSRLQFWKSFLSHWPGSKKVALPA